MISRNIAFERVKRLKKRYVEREFNFFGFKTIHLRDDERGDEPRSWFSVFVSFFILLKLFKVNFEKNPKRYYLHVVPII